MDPSASQKQLTAAQVVTPAWLELMLIGAADATVVPLILARRWKTPPV